MGTRNQDFAGLAPISGLLFQIMFREPFWSYCWVRLIPRLVKMGYRVIAPDFIGFGKSDKLVDFRSYNVTLHKEGKKRGRSLERDFGFLLVFKILTR